MLRLAVPYLKINMVQLKLLVSTCDHLITQSQTTNLSKLPYHKAFGEKIILWEYYLMRKFVPGISPIFSGCVHNAHESPGS